MGWIEDANKLCAAYFGILILMTSFLVSSFFFLLSSVNNIGSLTFQLVKKKISLISFTIIISS